MNFNGRCKLVYRNNTYLKTIQYTELLCGTVRWNIKYVPPQRPVNVLDQCFASISMILINNASYRQKFVGKTPIQLQSSFVDSLKSKDTVTRQYDKQKIIQLKHFNNSFISTTRQDMLFILIKFYSHQQSKTLNINIQASIDGGCELGKQSQSLSYQTQVYTYVAGTAERFQSGEAEQRRKEVRWGSGAHSQQYF